MTFVHLSEILQQFEWVLKYEQELSQRIKGQSWSLFMQRCVCPILSYGLADNGLFGLATIHKIIVDETDF